MLCKRKAFHCSFHHIDYIYFFFCRSLSWFLEKKRNGSLLLLLVVWLIAICWRRLRVFHSIFLHLFYFFFTFYLFHFMLFCDYRCGPHSHTQLCEWISWWLRRPRWQRRPFLVLTKNKKALNFSLLARYLRRRKIRKNDRHWWMIIILMFACRTSNLDWIIGRIDRNDFSGDVVIWCCWLAFSVQFWRLGQSTRHAIFYCMNTLGYGHGLVACIVIL